MKELGNELVTWSQLLVFVYGVLFFGIIVFYIGKWRYKRKVKREQKNKQ